jgi:Peptidase family M28/Endoplasmic reticulum metallopeptidase 1, C-terminal domain/Endoplasmic reticulum metallopeptidase 1, TM domain
MLPKPLTAETGEPAEFIEEHAMTHLREIVGYGIRTTGTYANEVQAPQYIVKALHDIQSQATAPGFRMEIDEQRPSGSFFLDFIGGLTSYYQNVTNVVVRISFPTEQDPTKYNIDHALLLSAHFDSALGSPAAADDTANIAVLMEIIRAISRDSTPLKHAVVFNLNGAEETLLQASHGFITKHKWRESIRAFVNLEAAGGSGQELVFQTGPQHAWLARFYSKTAPHPRATILGQEVFQSGAIPSDTDFRIYRDFGHIPGIDAAYISNGYLYHTIFDNADNIVPGSLQRCGENFLAFTRAVCNSEMLTDAAHHESETAVFYDVLGFFAVSYSFQFAFILRCSVLAAFAFLLLTQRHVFRGYVWQLLLVMFGSIFISLLFCVTVAGALMLSPASMVWYGYPLLTTGLFVCPTLLIWMVLQRGVFDRSIAHAKQRNDEDEMVYQRWYLQRDSEIACMLFWSIILVACTALNLGSGYVPMLAVMFPLLARFMQLPLADDSNAKGNTRVHTSSQSDTLRFLGVFYLGSSIPVLIIGVVLWILLQFFVPIMGRCGTEDPSDIVIAVLVSLCTSIICTFYVSLAHLVNRSWKVVRAILIVGFITCLIAAFSLHPYTSDHPKRMFLQHIERQWHEPMRLPEQQWDEDAPLIVDSVTKSDGGMFLNSMDHRNMDDLSLVANGKYADKISYTQCESGHYDRVYCDFPWYLPIRSMIPASLYIPGPAPTLDDIPDDIRPKLKIYSVTRSQGDDGRSIASLDIGFTGTDHMSLLIDARVYEVESWSFEMPVHMIDQDSDVWDPLYFIYIAAGTTPDGEFSVKHDYRFSFKLKVREDAATDEDGNLLPLRVVMYANYLDQTNGVTAGVKELSNELHDWMTPVKWASLWRSYIFN